MTPLLLNLTFSLPAGAEKVSVAQVSAQGGTG